VEVMGLGY